MKYDLLTRWLHAGIALGACIQLLSSLFMDVPAPLKPGTEPGLDIFRVHRWSGICVVSLVILHWLWAAGGHVSGGWGHLFPWFSKIRFNALVSDIKSLPAWLKSGVPAQEESTVPLAGAVHGLGLLTISAMAVSGTTIFFGMASNGAMGPYVSFVREGHSFMGNILWTYFIGHAGISIWHQLNGHRLITQMFNLAATGPDIR